MSEEIPNEATIFNAARQIETPEERDAFLSEACGDDSELRGRIEKLLAAYAEESQFLEQPAADLEATFLTGGGGRDLAAALEAGLAPAFGEDAAVVVGNAGHSVLNSLGMTVDMPRVVLRDSQAEGDGPIARPKSPEMPDRDSDSRYQLQGEIARGGMGAILKGRDTDLGRDLAIKVLLDAHKDKPEVIQRFVEEAQIGGQLQHPGIAPIYELGQFKDKRPFFAMKLVKGETLSKLLADREDAADERGKFIGIFEQVCQTMAYAHSRGVIHRDLKPANIMVGAFGEVQVMDWGLAKVLQVGGVADEKKSQNLQRGQSIIQTLRSGVGSDIPGTLASVGSQTQMGSVMGTPAYMPPEQALGKIDQMDERADVFGLGAILCEMLTGQPPYVGTDGAAVYRQASRGKLDDCMKRLDDCGADEDLIALTKHSLEQEPVDRPRDAGMLAGRVTSYLESVETRLREAEVQRAAEAARADAEAAQAVAERQHAESEGRRLEQQQRSAHKLRKMLVGLAVVAIIAVGTSIVAGIFWQEASIAQLAAEENEQTAQLNEQLATVSAEAARKSEAAAQYEARRADEQKRIAIENQSKAVASEKEATLLRKQAEERAELLASEDYVNRVNRAYGEVEHGNVAVAEDLLHGCPVERRGWEWHFVKRLSNSERQVLDLGDTSVNALAFSPDGTWIVSGSGVNIMNGSDDDAAMVSVWDVNSGQQRKTLQGTNGRVFDVAVSPDGNKVAAGCSNGFVIVWDVETGQVQWTRSGQMLHAYRLTFSPDGESLAVGYGRFSGGTIGPVKVWDAESGAEITTFNGPRGGVNELAFHPDGKRLAVAGSEVVEVWDVETTSRLLELKRHTKWIYCVAYSPDGKSACHGRMG